MTMTLEDLTADEIAEIKAKAGAGWKTNSLASRFGVQAHVIRRITSQKDTMPVASNEQADEELGIGEGELPPIPVQAAPAAETDNGFVEPTPQVSTETVAGDEASAIAALLNTPAMLAAIDAAVNARVAQLAAPTGSLDANLLSGFTSTIKHLIDTSAQQQPGYMKPLPAEVVAERAAGEVEMRALLVSYEAANTPPEYRVGESGFFECTYAIEKVEGQKIATYLPPCVDFRPLNAEARKVHAAMMRWIGGEQDEIGERVKQAHLDSKTPIIGADPFVQAARKPLIVDLPADPDDAEEAAHVKRRGMGTIVPDPIDMSARTPHAPSGPFA